MPKEPEIIKQEVIVVDVVEEVDQYGKLKFTDKGGNSYSISKKREHLFPLIQEDRAVELSWATYMDKNYIADAKLVDLPPEEPNIKEPPKKVSPPNPVTPPVESPKIDEKTHDIHRQVALKCAVELASHGIIKVGELKEKSEILLKYLDGE